MKQIEIEGVIQTNSYGSGYLLRQDEEDIYIYKKNIGQALNGDHIKIQTIPSKQPGKIEGKVLEVLERKTDQFVGILSISKKKNKTYGFVIPDSKKMCRDIFIPEKNLENFKHGEKVLCKITKWYSDAKNPNGEIIESLGYPGDNDTEMNSIVYEYGFDLKFPNNVEDEADKVDFEIPKEEIEKRRDFRDVTTFTIDPKSAKDFDDALSVRRLENGNIEVGIHIADVSHYVKEDTELDKEAYKRATSVYLVDRVIPMLPERLSNGVCSLRPNEEKLSFSSVFELDNDGIILNEWYGKTVIYSDRRFAYEDAQDMIENGDNSETDDYRSEVLLLDRLAKKIRKRRMKHSISFNKSEAYFELDDEGKPLNIYFKESKDANKLIEEFMLLANKRVAKFISDKSKSFVYRTHDEPNEEKLQELSVIVNEFGHHLNIETDNIKANLNKLLESVKGEPEQNMVEQLSVRCMSKAKYEVVNIGHYGLGFDNYTHFTSPIRRYPDLLVHRLLFKYLEKPKSDINPTSLNDKCTWCSYKELNASRAERSSIKFKQVEYLMDKKGEEFKGVVTGVLKWGIYVELINNKCEGLVGKDNLSYTIDPDKYRIYSQDEDGEEIEIRLGDEVTVKVLDVNLMKREINFELVE
jgi:ribonuclease R